MQVALSAIVWIAILRLVLKREEQKRPVYSEAAAASLFIVLDYLLLVSPSVFGLAESAVAFPLLCMVTLRANLFQAALALRRRSACPRQRSALFALNTAVSGCLCYALLIEPYAIRLERVGIASARLKSSTPLRIVQLSDLHVERFGLREKRLLELLETLQYDLIVLTGDYLHLARRHDEQALRAAKQVLASLKAPHGIYAVAGNVDHDPVMKVIFRDLPITVLDGQSSTLQLRGHTINLAGLSTTRWEKDAQRLETLFSAVPRQNYTILLYHTPNLADEAAANGADLYLAGHTHGGQIRIPFYGAIATLARHGKRFEQGLYPVGPASLYVNRGIGVEGFAWTPGLRFLTPPEVTLFELRAP